MRGRRRGGQPVANGANRPWGRIALTRTTTSRRGGVTPSGDCDEGRGKAVGVLPAWSGRDGDRAGDYAMACGRSGVARARFAGWARGADAETDVERAIR